MRKFSRTKQYIKYLSCAMAVIIGLSQPWAALAEEEQVSQEVTAENGDADEIKYITSFETLAEEDAYFSCMYKPSLIELLSVFPETIYIWTEGAESSGELEVTWECEEDFDATHSEIYVFYPKWDETLYAIADTADSVEIPSITVEVPVGGGIISDLNGAKDALKNISEQKSILALIYLCDEYEVKDSPSYDGTTIHTVLSGQSVQITDVELGEYGDIWYRVLFYQNSKEYAGYVEKGYLATSDEDFADWEDTYLDLSAVPMMMDLSAGYPDVEQFPASYQNALYALKEKHPDWTFVRMDTGLDWNTAITKEMGDKSLISSKTSGSWQNGTYGQGWSYASEGILKYYMDPRNFLNDPAIFQFEQLTYNESYHTTSSVQEVIKGSFMSSAIPGDSRTYAQAFTEIGKSQNVSPFHLAARVLQEQGTQGTSPLISGTYPGYEGYYNYFNVEASGKTDLEVIISGLKRAVASGWNTRFKSLNGGAAVIGANYITKGQDTVYLEKFNVSNGKYANFTHQYMQNIQAPDSEAVNIRKAYNNAGALENSFVFKIPVYNNMPASACSKPEAIDAITLDKTTSSLEVNKTVTLIPYVNGSKVDYVSDMTFTSSNTSVATVDNQGKVTAISPGTTTISCTRSGANTATCTVTVVKTNPSVQTPVLSPYTYRDGLKLSDIVLPDGWSWEKESTQITVGTFSYPALYTPADTTKYNVIKKDISFTVTKAIPDCQMPGRFEAKTGTLLGDISLPSGFTWESSTTTELKEAGEYTFYVSYNPNENNYYTVEHLTVIVGVIGTSSKPSEGNQGSGSTTSGSTTTGGGSVTSGSTTTGGGSVTSGSTITGGGSTTSGSTTTGDGSTTSGSTTTGGGSTTSGSTTTGGGSTTSGSTTTGGGSTSTGSTMTGANTSSGGTTTTSVSVPTGNAPSNNSTAGNGTNDNSSNNSTVTEQSVVNNNPPTNSNSIDNSNSTDNSNTPNSSTAGNSQPEAGTVSNVGAVADQVNNTVVTGVASESAPIEENADQSNAVGQDASASETGASQRETSQTEASQAPVFRPSVTMPMEDTTILTVEKLQAAKGQNFNLVLDMGNSATWNIDVDSVDMSTVSEVDMGITFRTENIPTDLIAEILDGNKYLEFTLNHNGDFGFDPVLNVALDPANRGRYANLFYYNPEEDALEYICSSVIEEDGEASFRMEHASSYVIIVSDAPMSGVSISYKSDSDMTWWIIGGILIGLILVITGCSIFFCRRKKQDEDTKAEEAAKISEKKVNKKKVSEKKQEESAAQPETEIKEPDMTEQVDEDEESDWIEDEDWHEPEIPEKIPEDRSGDDHAEDDWIDDDEWNSENEWVDDDEWEKMNGRG